MLGNVFILGDSYSTFKGYIPPGYSCYYESNGPDYVTNNTAMELTNNDVCKVEQTWWYSLINEYGNLLRNCSWSGTTICNTGYDGEDYSEISFIARIEKVLKDGYFEENMVDTIFLFGGTNDSWADSPIGELKYENWEKEDLFFVLPAFCYLLNELSEKLKDTKVYFILNTELKAEIENGFVSACKQYDVSVIRLKNIDKTSGHPTVKGMKQIKEQILLAVGI